MIDADKFFASVRSHLFGGEMTQSQVDGCNGILDAWGLHAPKSDPRFIAYSLATAFWETARTMQPIEEEGKGEGHPYGKPVPPDGQIYFGRGLVQLTWLADYEHASKQLRAHGMIGSTTDLVKNPELALHPDVASAILVYGMLEGWFTGRKLSQYFVGTRSDWTDARAIINGRDHAALVGGYGLTFLHALGG